MDAHHHQAAISYGKALARTTATIIAVATFAGCSADQATAPSARGAEPPRPVAAIEDLTDAAIIYDQRSSGADALGVAAFRPVYLADDFVVWGSWKLTDIVLSGRLFEPALTFALRYDNNGKPGLLVSSFTSTSTGVDGDGDIRSGLFPVSTTPTLLPGRYWLTVLVNSFDGTTARGLFSWQKKSAVSGGEALMSTNVAVTEWGPASPDGTPFDFGFVVFGDALQGTQIVTFPAIEPNPATVGATASLSASLSSGNRVRYTSLTPTICTVTQPPTPAVLMGSVSYIATGTCTVQADHPGFEGFYYPAEPKTRSVQVDKAGQAITFTSVAPSSPVVGGSYTVAATGGGSGNPVVFSSLTTGTCLTSGTTVSFVGPGPCTVAANQAGSATHEAAPEKTQEMTVGQASQTIEFTSRPPIPAVPGERYTVEASGGASGNPVTFTTLTPSVCELIGDVARLQRVGTCTVLASQAGNTNYAAAPQKMQSFLVTKLPQGITFTSTPPSPGYLNATYAVAATGGASGNPVTFSVSPAGVCTLGGTTVTLVGFGTCTITANQAGTTRYDAAPPETQTITVSYKFDGFASPVDNGGVLNTAKAGKTIPLKWRLTDAAGLPVTNLTTVTLTAKELSCALGSSEDQVEEYAAGSSGLQNLGDGYYQFNWTSPSSYAKSCKTVTLTLGDGGTKTALFQFTK